jgi:hypothetical protein
MPIGEIIFLPNGHLELTTSEHGKLTLSEWKITPLKLESLQDYKENGKVHITLTDLTVLEDPEITEITVTNIIPDVLGAYCLVQGGWVPPGFGMINSTVFADRNFISKLTSNFEGDKAKNTDLAKWFSDLKNFNFQIDIIPFAVEGNKKRFPSKNEVVAQIKEARDKLQVAAPGIEITKYRIPLQDYAWKLVTGLEPYIQKRMDFLTQAAPLIKPSSKKEIILKRWQSIADIAKDHGLSTDIIHFVALISISAPQKNSPGLDILKINHPYPQEKAYNACCDISQMELLINLQRMNPSGKYAIITSDLGLVRFGGLLNDLTHKTSDDDNLTLSAKIQPDLIGSDPELHKAFRKLISGNASVDSLE